MPYIRPSQQAADAAEQVRVGAEARAARIRAQSRLKPEIVRAELARSHRQAAQQMAQVQADAQKQAAAEKRRLTAKAFGIDDIADHAVDKAVVAVNYRDAQDRVAKLETVREAEEMLHRAEATGDELLARAVAQRAFDQRAGDASWQGPLNTYLSGRPQAEQAISSLLDSQQRPDIAGLLAFALATPSELTGLGDHQIAALADQHPDAG